MIDFPVYHVCKKVLVDGERAGDVEMIPAHVLQQMIASLPVERRTVFNMYCIDGFSHKDIAKALNISEKGSASVLAKARAGLKKAISDYLKGTR